MYVDTRFSQNLTQENGQSHSKGNCQNMADHDCFRLLAQPPLNLQQAGKLNMIIFEKFRFHCINGQFSCLIQ